MPTAKSEGWLRAWTGPSAGSPLHDIDTQDQSFSVSSVISVKQSVVISGGTFTALTVPASALGVVIKIPTAGGNTLIWKAASADTGWRVDTAVPLQSSVQQGAAMGFSNTGANVTIECWFF